jgi:hypothetical protein
VEWEEAVERDIFVYADSPASVCCAQGSGLCTGVLLGSNRCRFLLAEIGSSGCCIEPADASPDEAIGLALAPFLVGCGTA